MPERSTAYVLCFWHEPTSEIGRDRLRLHVEVARHVADRPPVRSERFYAEEASFRTEGLPSRFDGSYFGNASGSLVSQVRSTLHHLDLIDEERRPTELLKIIADADDAEQKQHLRTIFEEKYSDALALGKNATSGELADVFRNRGLTGATVEKAITFYLGMAQDLGVPFGSAAARRHRRMAEGETPRICPSGIRGSIPRPNR
jgi:hypothetical protein